MRSSERDRRKRRYSNTAVRFHRIAHAKTSEIPLYTDDLPRVRAGIARPCPTARARLRAPMADPLG